MTELAKNTGDDGVGPIWIAVKGTGSRVEEATLTRQSDRHTDRQTYGLGA